MKIITEAREMQRQAERLRQEGKKIVFVPTMGALHEGHLSLFRKAGMLGDVVVASIYVNPTQFGPKEDFSRYPRPLEQDLVLAKKEGVDFVFAPKSLYFKDSSTFVEETECSKGRCGAFRPGHFRGVATVVCKLLNIVRPHIAVFGQKDGQQCEVIERMVRDLFLPVEIVRTPIVREPSGIALSSRNRYLSDDEYERALGISKSLREAVMKRGLSARKIEQIVRRILLRRGLKPQYVTWANGFICVAIRVGKARLLDNIAYHVER